MDGTTASSMHLKCFIRNRLINIDPLFDSVLKGYSTSEPLKGSKGGKGGGISGRASGGGNSTGPREKARRRERETSAHVVLR